MAHSKRHGEILRLLQEEGTVTIASLADRLGVSLETVRRDVKPLTSDGSVLKMHGAIGLPSMIGEAPFERHMRENADAKRVIARMVAATIRDGESIMLDTGTTTSFLARTVGAFSPMPPANTRVSTPPNTAAKAPIHFLTW